MQSNHPPIWSGSIPSKRHPLPRLLRVVCGSLLLIGLMHLTFSIFALESAEPRLLAQADGLAEVPSAPALAVEKMAKGEICDAVTDMPVPECQALVDLYNLTDGTNWLTRTGWLSVAEGFSPCSWYGVRCEAGHVVDLNLSANRLRVGPSAGAPQLAIPSSIAQLSRLRSLDLSHNQLVGRIPLRFCSLRETLSELDLGYNGLFTRRAKIERCLSDSDPDWQQSQTIAPIDMEPTAFFTNSVMLSWTPVSYTVEGGVYQIGVSTQADGPYRLHGETADRNVSSYVVDGLNPGKTYFFQIRSRTPAMPNHPDEIISDFRATAGVTQSPGEKLLLISYFPADNDLSSYIQPVLERVRRGTAKNPLVQAIFLADGMEAGDTQIFLIANGIITPTAIVEEEWGTPELDTGDPAILAWFLRYARQKFPADRTVVALMGHGLALTPEIEWPEIDGLTKSAQVADSLANPIPALPRDWEATPSDITDRGYMSTVDVGKALMAASDNGANPFDILFFDQCFQGNLDLLYEVYQSADAIVASPNYGWLVAAYHQYIVGLTPSDPLQDAVYAIVNRYQANLNNEHPNVIFGLQSSNVPIIADAVSQLGDALRAANAAGENERISLAVNSAQFVDTTQCGRQNLTLGPPDELIGAGSFATNLQKYFKVDDPYGVHAAAEAVLASLESIYSRVRVGNPYLAPEETWNYTDTVTILAPLRPDSRPAVAWRSSIYREDVPFTARYTPVPTMTVTVSETFAYVREGRWDNFINEWYTNELTPTVGAWCNYIPPTELAIEDIEPLSLTVQGNEDGTWQLSWTETSDLDANGYTVLARGPYNVQKVIQAVVPLSQTQLTLTELDAGAHSYEVVANDTDGLMVAQSESMSIDVPEEPNPNPISLPGSNNIYLPLVAE